MRGHFSVLLWGALAYWISLCGPQLSRTKSSTQTRKAFTDLRAGALGFFFFSIRGRPAINGC